MRRTKKAKKVATPSHGSIRSGLDHWRMTISQTYANTENTAVTAKTERSLM